MIFISFIHSCKYISSSLVSVHRSFKESVTTGCFFFNFSKSTVDFTHAIPKQRENARCSIVVDVH